MKFILYILMCIYIYTIFKNIIALIYIYKWINSAKKNRYIIKDKKVLVYLIIPMLNEQKIAKKTYLNFKQLTQKIKNVKVMFVTTSKEVKKDGNLTTYEILKELIKNDDKIFLCNYPQKTGVMAHQVNYALKEIEKYRFNHEKIIIGVYNADSKINVETIEYVLEKEENKNENEDVCYQQYSWYKLCNNSKHKGIIASASLWQTRWSLTFEIFRVKQQEWINTIYEKVNRFKTLRPFNKILYIVFEKMNYVIGHGFYMDIDLLHKIGGFPENTINEDAFLGYIINNKNIKIDAIPYLEKADFAPSIPVYIKQQTTWVNGPIYAFEYLKLYKNNNKLKISEKIRAFILAIKLFLHFVYWLASPYILLFVLPILLYKFYYILGLIMAILIILLELPFTHYLVRRVIISNITEKEKCELAKPSVYCIIFFIIHSFGAIRNIYLQAIGKNKMENKYKTERE